MPIYSVRYISNDVDESLISQSFQYTPEKRGEYEAKGELFALITAEGEKGIDCERISKFVWDSIVDSYYYSSFTTVIDNLKESVASGSRKAAELIRNETELEGKGINLSFALVVFKGRGVYVTVFGEQQVFLYKNGGVVKVSDIVAQNKGVVASLAWSDTDLLLLSSPKLLDSYSSVLNQKENVSEVVKNIGRNSLELEKSQAILMLTGKQYLVPQPKTIKREVVENKVDSKIEDNKKEELKTEDKIVESEIAKDKYNIKTTIEDRKGKENTAGKSKFSLSSLKNKLPKLNAKLYFDRLKDFKFIQNIKPAITKILAGIRPFLGKVKMFWNKFLDFVIKSWGKLMGKLNNLVQNKYGRQHWYKSLMSKLSSLSFSKRKTGGVGIKIDGYKDTELKKKRFATLFLIVAGIISIFILFNLSKKTQERNAIIKEANSLILDFQKELGLISGDTLDDDQIDFSINRIETELIPQIEKTLENYKESNSYIDYVDTLKVYKAFDDKKDKRFYVNDSDNTLELFFDARAELGDKTNIIDMFTYKDDLQNEYIFLTDSGNNIVFKIDLSNKSSRSTIGDSRKLLKEPMYIDWGNKGIYVYDKQQGILLAKFDKQKKITDFVKVAGLDIDVIGDSEINDIAILGQFDSIFFLSKQENAVIKSTGLANGYALPYTYIQSKTFSSANNFANDNNIYVLTSTDRGIERYVNNPNQTASLNRLSITGLDIELGNIKAGYTYWLENSKFFAFDEGEKRVLVFEKPVEISGQLRHPKELFLEAQYYYNGNRPEVFSDVKELVSDYNDNYVYILDGNKVWRIKVK